MSAQTLQSKPLGAGKTSDSPGGSAGEAILGSAEPVVTRAVYNSYFEEGK